MRSAYIDSLADELGYPWLRMEPAEVYDAAVIGFVGGQLVYDCERVIELTVAHEGVSWAEALEWHEFNTFDAHVGPHTPLFMDRLL